MGSLHYDHFWWMCSGDGAEQRKITENGGIGLVNFHLNCRLRNDKNEIITLYIEFQQVKAKTLL